MPADVVVVGLGMMTAVGVSAAETGASVRAGIARFAETPFRDKRFAPFRLAEIPTNALPPLARGLEAAAALSAREERMLRLATLPLRECLAPLKESVGLGLCLAVPELETARMIDRQQFLRHLAVQTGGVFQPDRSDASHLGRAGGILAIGQAVATIQQGLGDLVLAGGIDTYRDLYILGTLDREQRVKSALNLDGFIPGEGAAFVLLASARAAAERALTPIASVSPVAIGFETGHLYSAESYRGDGLAGVLSQLIAQGAVSAPIGDVYSSMNGESHWAKEWGVGFMRSRAAFDEGHGMHHPADCFGDTGAAAGPLLVGLAAQGVRGRYSRSPALVYGSSDRGARAALIVSAAAH